MARTPLFQGGNTGSTPVGGAILIKKDQKFLTKNWVAKKLVEALEIKSDDLVIEIGGGKGRITQFLKGKIIVVEKDPLLAEILKEKFKEKENIKIYCGDFLKFPLPKQKYKIIGNIPYSIAGKIIRKVFNPKKPPEIAVFTFPETLGEKILKESPKGNFLSYYIHIFSKPKKILFIDKNLFRPKPKLNSIAIKFEFKELPEDVEKIVKFLKICFKSPRKTLKNNLKKFINEEDLEKVLKKCFPEKDIKNLRAHELKPEDLIYFYREIKNYLKN